MCFVKSIWSRLANVSITGSRLRVGGECLGLIWVRAGPNIPCGLWRNERLVLSIRNSQARMMMIRTPPSSCAGQPQPLSALGQNSQSADFLIPFSLTELWARPAWAGGGQSLVNCQGPPLRLSRLLLTAQLLIIGEKHKKWLLTLSLKQMLKLIYDSAPNVFSRIKPLNLNATQSKFMNSSSQSRES